MSDNQKFIPIAKPWLGDEEALATHRPILSGWVTQGPEVKAFEAEFAAYTGAKFASAVGNCTAALHLALKAVGVGAGDEVITVSHSFIATVNSVRYCNAIPVLCDIDPETYNLNPDLIEQNISERTKAILCVHQVGMPCDLAKILELAHRHQIPVIEDAACAIGSEIQLNGAWAKIGQPHGDISCFSFHPRKVITTGDGGMLTTSNPEWDAKFRLWRQHSMGVSDTKRHSADQVIFESYPELGYNYRLTDIQAAVGREQLKRLPDIISRRRLLADRYRELLSAVPGIIPPVEPEWARSNWQSYGIRLEKNLSQSKFMQKLLDRGIATRRGVQCCHREPAYRQEIWKTDGQVQPYSDEHNNCEMLKHSEATQDQVVFLPLFHQLQESEVEFIATEIKSVVTSWS